MNIHPGHHDPDDVGRVEDADAGHDADPIATTLDEDLVLYHYRDGLPPERMGAIADALHASPELRARYAELCTLLDAASRVPVPRPSHDLEDRIWERLQRRMHDEPRLAPRRATRARGVAAAVRRARGRSGTRPWAMAAALLLALALGIVIGGGALRQPAAPPIARVAPAGPAAGTVAHDEAFAARMLDAYVAGHLRASQGLLMTTLNTDDGALSDSGAALAASLVESNRLYAAAATRAGNSRLAAVLGQLEPLLIELANPPRGDDVEVRKGLREYVRDSDLLFRLRATEARIDPRGQRRA